MRAAYAVLFVGVAVLGVGAEIVQRGMPPRTLPTGKLISPEGDSTGVGSFPCNILLTKSRKFLIVTDSGFRENLSVLDASSGTLVSQMTFPARTSGLYYGIACQAMTDGTELVAVSHGARDTITLYSLDGAGKLAESKTLRLPETVNPLRIPNHATGLAWSKDGRRLYVVANQSHVFNDFKGSVLALDPQSGDVIASRPVGSFPFSVAVLPSGDVAVTDEGGREVMVLDGDLKNSASIATGEQPSYETLNHAGTRLYVSNSNGDTVSEIDTGSKKVLRTLLLRPNALRGYPGVTPLGSALSPDDRTLYVAMGDLNAVAVVDLSSGKVKGYAPAGWYPTSVAVTNAGHTLFVAEAKGVQSENPNNVDVKDWGRYAPNILEGTVSKIDLDQVSANLPSLTALVTQNNHLDDLGKIQFHNPGIRHVFYVIKENRTFDQVLGDIKQGNGDASLTIFGQDVTPNQHALAERFGLYDNFYVCAEVSADGWNWSTSGQANEYTERNVPYNYSGRGRDYDFEGTNNGSPVDLLGHRDVAESAGGYLWDAVLAKGLSVRNYGMFLTFNTPQKAPDGNPVALDNQPARKNLVPLTCTDFRKFDLAYPDSDAEAKLDLPRAPREISEYGSHHDHDRMETWLREFKGYVANDNLPSLNLIRLPRNHTSGTSKGLPSPRAMVADNDYAVGELVDAISHSPYWKSSAIVVLEDDAQDGFDHVDCHRSPILVISPYTAKGLVDSSFYNTDSALATIERLLGVKPGNQYLATARPFDVFRKEMPNPQPYEAILPDKAVIGQVNGDEAYRSEDSGRLISLYDEDSCADFELNEILWHSIKGLKAPLPQTPGVIWSGKPTKDADD